MLKKYIFFGLLSCIVSQQAYGTIDPVFTNGVSGMPSQIPANTVFSVTDNLYTTPVNWSAIESTQLVEDLVIFEFANDANQHRMTNVSTNLFTLTFQVTGWNDAGVSTILPQETLTLNYNGTASNQSDSRNFKRYTGYHKIDVKVVSILAAVTPTAWPAFAVRGEIKINRIYKFNCNSIPVSSALDTTATKVDYVPVTWTAVAGADEYDIEWVFYDSLSAVGNSVRTKAATPLYTNFNWLYANNASRVTVSATNFSIPLLYPAGFVFFRIRAAQYDANGDRRYTKWSSDGWSSTALHQYPHRRKLGWHERTLNWQAKVSFAEEGKHVPSVTYYDPSLRARQEVTRSNAINGTIASSTVYDAQGRAAVSVIPAPTFETHIRFDSLLAASGTGTTPYTKTNFEKADCASIPDAMATQKGSSRYFSASNPQVSVAPNPWIPSAQGFPFTVTEFTPDLTGRVKRVSGVGLDHRMGSGRETKYLYGKPAQIHLDRLFGSEAGYASHYLKNAVIDPNGQVSVTYLDAHGRTVATALAGNSPANLDSLPNKTQPIRLVADLMNNVKQGTEFVSTSTLLITTPTGLDSLRYQLAASFYKPDCLPVNSPICYDCQYDLEIRVTDNCGNAFNGGVPRIYRDSTYTVANLLDTLCANAPGNFDELLIFANLPIGEYVVTKKLSLNTKSLEYYVEHFLKQTPCIPNLNALISQYQNQVDISGCGLTCATCYAEAGTEAAYLSSRLSQLIAGGITAPTAQDSAMIKADYAAIIAECDEMCKEQSDCQLQLEGLVADMQPGGQYADYVTNATTGLIEVTDPLSIYFGSTPPYKSITYYKKGSTTLLDSIQIGESMFSPKDVPLDVYIDNFQDYWADQLVVLHPEWACHQKTCTGNMAASNSFDSLLQSFTSFAAALAAGVVDANGNIIGDPFYLPGGAGAGLNDTLQLLWQGVNNTVCYSYSVPNSIAFAIHCGTIDTLGFGEGQAPDVNLQWQAIVSAYLGYKKRKMEGLFAECKTATLNCIESTDAACASSPYRDKQRRVVRMPANPEPPSEAWLQAQSNNNVAAINAQCQSVCEAYSTEWMKILAGCFNIADTAAARQRLIKVCRLGCDETHPFGSNTTKNNVGTVPEGDKSFDDVINAYLPNPSCDTCLGKVNFPGAYDAPVYLGASYTPVGCDNCICENLDSLKQCFLAAPQGYATFPDFLARYSNVKLTQAQIDTLTKYCQPASASYQFPPNIPVPPYLECNKCKSCEEINAMLPTLHATCPVGSANYEVLRMRYLNKKTGFALTVDDYTAFFARCATRSLNVACNNAELLCPMTNMVTGDTSCFSILMDLAAGQAQIVYEAKLDSLAKEFRRKYIDKCLNTAQEVFTHSGLFNEYHYTLYYYDQAGNLIKTVPPKGVTVISAANTLKQIADYRALTSATPPNPPVSPVPTAVYPAHTLATRYVYNTLNQVKRERSPDKGETQFWYDKIGRPIVSQDARQQPLNKYSYTLYDAGTGRILEVGELTSATAMTDATAFSQTLTNTWLTNAASTRADITETTYDEALNGAPGFGTAGQENLRYRISKVAFYKTAALQTAKIPESATHYSYDALGNVKTLIQDLRHLQRHRYKRVDYNYDFVSGKVNSVYYQKDSTDQFIHKYLYDANNRLTTVQTYLIDGSITAMGETDASYQYYLHGPLSRTVLGERKVQGLDYAYTIHGWMKVLNRSAINYINSPSTYADMGYDGVNAPTASNRYIGRNVLGYALNYYEGDYLQICATCRKAEVPQNTTGTGIGTASPSLYNGNIRNMVTHLPQFGDPNGYSYKYDQLNRLKSMDRWVGPINTTSWPTNLTTTGQYNERIQYDPNGNITSYQRNGNLSGADTLMDNLGYGYTTGTNRLSQVIDNQGVVARYATDIDGASNYAYDATGNLISDTNNGVSSILWNAYGKVERITRLNGQVTVFGYDGMQNRIMKAVHSGADTTFTFYVRDAQGNVLGVYSRFSGGSGSITWAEQHIYGSGRLGSFNPSIIWTNASTYSGPHYATTRRLLQGQKRYELSNHLGNVLVTINDRRIPRDGNTADNIAEYYDALVLSANDYYPFGMEMPGRTFALSSGYRYGFNGQEKVTELGANHTTAQFWEYDARIGRRWNVDIKPQPFRSSYDCFQNNPIFFIDPNGDSTFVSREQNGTYRVFDGTLDNDSGIYVKKDGLVQELIGYSATPESFYFSENRQWTGVINPSDNSGRDFLSNALLKEDPNAAYYMWNATGGEKYDFKRTNGTENVQFENPEDFYRGMPLNLTGPDATKPVYASARDIGNIGAGLIAGRAGLSWSTARFGFDALETKQKFGAVKTTLFYPFFGVYAQESSSTQFGERLGWRIGTQVNQAEQNDQLRRLPSHGAVPKITISNAILQRADFKP